MGRASPAGANAPPPRCGPLWTTLPPQSARRARRVFVRGGHLTVALSVCVECSCIIHFSLQILCWPFLAHNSVARTRTDRCSPPSPRPTHHSPEPPPRRIRLADKVRPYCIGWRRSPPPLRSSPRAEASRLGFIDASCSLLAAPSLFPSFSLPPCGLTSWVSIPFTYHSHLATIANLDSSRHHRLLQLHISLTTGA